MQDPNPKGAPRSGDLNNLKLWAVQTMADFKPQAARLVAVADNGGIYIDTQQNAGTSVDQGANPKREQRMDVTPTSDVKGAVAVIQVQTRGFDGVVSEAAGTLGIDGKVHFNEDNKLAADTPDTTTEASKIILRLSEHVNSGKKAPPPRINIPGFKP